MKRILGVAVVMAVALVMFSPSAQAEFYLGASAMQTNLKVEDASIEFNEDDLGWKVFGGYNFIKYFGLELGYYDMGKPSSDQGEVKLKGAALAARGILPLGKHFEFSARLGYMAWDASVSGDEGEDGADLTYGLGAAVIIGSHAEIRLEYEIVDAGASDVDRIDIEIISLGAAFRF
jgi:OOP family OmpA-OmpF porin